MKESYSNMDKNHAKILESNNSCKKQWKNHGRILVRNLINNSGKKQWKNHGRILART